MRIKSVSIIGLPPYKKRFVLPPNEDVLSKYNVIILRGPNGSGKTTFIETVLSSLFSNKLLEKDSRVSPSTSVEIALSLENGDEAKVIRSGRQRVTVWLYPKDGGRRQMKFMEFLQHALSADITSSDLKSLKELSLISFASGENLEEHLADLMLSVLRITSFEKLIEAIRKKLGDKVTELRLQSGAIKKKLADIERELDRRLRELQTLEEYVLNASKRLKAIEEELEGLEQEVEQLKREKHGLLALLEELKGKKEEFEGLKKDLQALKRLPEGLSSEILLSYHEFLSYGGFDTIKTMEALIANATKLGLPEDPEAIAGLVEELREEYEKLNEELRRCTGERQAYEAKLKELKRRLESVERRKSEYEREVREIKRKLEAWIGKLEGDPEALVQERLERIKRELNNARAKVSRLEGLVEAIEKLLQDIERQIVEGKVVRCPICGSELTVEEAREIIKRKREESEELRKEKEEARRKIRELENAVRELEALRSEAARLKTLEEELRKALEEYSETLIEFKKVKKQLEEARKAYEEAYRKYSLAFQRLNVAQTIAQRLESRRKAMAALRNIGELDESVVNLIRGKAREEILALMERLKKISELEEAYRKYVTVERKLSELSRELDAKERRLNELKRQRDKLLTDISTAQGKIETVRKRISELRELIKEERKKAVELERKYKRANRIINALTKRGASLENAVRKHVIEKASKALNNVLAEYVEAVNALGGGVIIREIKVKAEHKRSTTSAIVAKLNVKLEYDEKERDLKTLSSGEKRLVLVLFASAFRKALGFSKVPLFLDEPTAHADASTRDKIAYILSKALEAGIVPQVFITTHDEQFVRRLDEIMTDERIYHVELKKNASGVDAIIRRSFPRRAAWLFSILSLSRV